MFRMGHGGPRRRRGDVRAAILALLGDRPMHGYEMIQELEERSEGMWRPSAGSIYPTLQLLEDEGLIAGEEHDGKRRFTLTDAGREEAAKRPADRPPPWEQAAEGHPQELFASIKLFAVMSMRFRTRFMCCPTNMCLGRPRWGMVISTCTVSPRRRRS